MHFKFQYLIVGAIAILLVGIWVYFYFPLLPKSADEDNLTIIEVLNESNDTIASEIFPDAGELTLPVNGKVDMGFGGTPKSPLFWAVCNVGATSPEEYGGLYGWADTSGVKHSDNLNDYPSSDPPKNISGSVQYDIARAKWGSNWRLPTFEEMEGLSQNCIGEFVNYKGVNGYKLTSKINGNSLFFPASGVIYHTKLLARNTEGHYWTGTLSKINKGYASYLFFYKFRSSLGENSVYRYYHLAVRPVCSELINDSE